MEIARSIELLACVNFELAATFVRILEVKVEDDNAMYTKVIVETLQTKMEFGSCIFSLVSVLKAEEDCGVKVTGDLDGRTRQPLEDEYMSRCLQEKEEALRKRR